MLAQGRVSLRGVRGLFSFRQANHQNTKTPRKTKGWLEMRDVAITGVLPALEGKTERLAPLFGYQETFQCHFMIADYQALTRKGQHGIKMNRAIQATVERFLVAGFDPEQSVCFLQSAVPQLSELTMILGNLVTLTDLLSKHIRKQGEMPKRTSLSVVGYPVSQVADILMFGARYVLVFESQRENIELAQAVACRFNDAYEEVFPIPTPYFCEDGDTVVEAVKTYVPTFVNDVLNLGGSQARIRGQQTLERVKAAMGMNY